MKTIAAQSESPPRSRNAFWSKSKRARKNQSKGKIICALLSQFSLDCSCAKMPDLGLPKTQEEHDLWVKAIAAQSGVAVDGVDKHKKARLLKRFYVSNGKLFCREMNKRVLVLTEFDSLWKTHHIDANHPGKKLNIVNP